MKQVRIIGLCIGMSVFGNMLYAVRSAIEGERRRLLDISFLYKTTEQIFTDIYNQNFWRGGESLSGQGSNRSTTQFVRALLPKLCKKLKIKTMVDAPCGDFNWMQYVIDELDLERYIGIDIVKEAICLSQEKHSTPNRTFVCADLITYVPERADLIFSRDCLAHLCYEDAFRVIKNFKASGSAYLLTSHHVNTTCNSNIVTGRYYPINLQLAPFNFPESLLIVEEADTERASSRQGKSLALWRLADIDVEKLGFE